MGSSSKRQTACSVRRIGVWRVCVLQLLAGQVAFHRMHSTSLTCARHQS
jgi:hypothetical protein